MTDDLIHRKYVGEFPNESPPPSTEDGWICVCRGYHASTLMMDRFFYNLWDASQIMDTQRTSDPCKNFPFRNYASMGRLKSKSMDPCQTKIILKHPSILLTSTSRWTHHTPAGEQQSIMLPPQRPKPRSSLQEASLKVQISFLKWHRNVAERDGSVQKSTEYRRTLRKDAEAYGTSRKETELLGKRRNLSELSGMPRKESTH